MGIVTTQKQVEDKARQIAGRVFADGTMRTMLYELIVDAFGSPRVGAREVKAPGGASEGAGDDDCG